MSQDNWYMVLKVWVGLPSPLLAVWIEGGFAVLPSWILQVRAAC
jgi:hypothetical protein